MLVSEAVEHMGPPDNPLTVGPNQGRATIAACRAAARSMRRPQGNREAHKAPTLGDVEPGGSLG